MKNIFIEDKQNSGRPVRKLAIQTRDNNLNQKNKTVH